MTEEEIPYSKEFNEFLYQFITPERKAIQEQVINDRTRHITVVIEDVFQPHNASAVIRTCDCFGIQDLHIIEKKNKYVINPKVALGSGKWVDIIKHNSAENNTIDCLKKLKSQGYKIVATTPHENDVSLYDMPVDQPLALVFGNELTGLSDYAKAEADVFMKIPMYGFTESFNISVSAALCLSFLTEKLRKTDLNWQLTEEEKSLLMFKWAQTRLGNTDKFYHEFNRLKNEIS